ncbi:TPA: hypothetical protein ACX6PH_003445 [Photobacterium damselae]
MRFFSLLHLAENEKTAMNCKVKEFDEQILIYLNNAINLSKSLKSRGYNFTLLTNNSELLENIISHNNKEKIEIIEIDFISNIPKGISFYSAHYKLDAMRYISTLDDTYCFFCDLDMVCINDLPESVINIIDANIPMYYDISDQVIPAYGEKTIIKDISKVNKLHSEGRWSGGEFLSGPPCFFKELCTKCDEIFTNYTNNIDRLHHVGDEAFVSSALEILRRNGIYISDAGTLNIIGRFWSTNVLHIQKNFSFYENHFLLHLPADKKFLSEYSDFDHKKNSNDFIFRYKKYLVKINVINNIKKIVKIFIRK